MEDELSKQLFIREKRKITLPDKDIILRKCAEEILDLVKKTESEVTLSDETITSDIYIGASKTDAIRYLAKAAHSNTIGIRKCSSG